MKVGEYYVVRVMPNHQRGDSLKVESVGFDPTRNPAGRPDYALKMASDWKEFVQSQFPKREFLLVQVVEPIEEES